MGTGRKHNFFYIVWFMVNCRFENKMQFFFLKRKKTKCMYSLNTCTAYREAGFSLSIASNILYSYGFCAFYFIMRWSKVSEHSNNNISIKWIRWKWIPPKKQMYAMLYETCNEIANLNTGTWILLTKIERIYNRQIWPFHYSHLPSFHMRYIIFYPIPFNYSLNMQLLLH